MLCREPIYSAVVIFSLAIGFSVFFLLIGFVRYSFEYDKNIPDSDSIYVLKTRSNVMRDHNWREWVALPYRDVVVKSGLALASTAVVPFPVSMRTGSNSLYRAELSAVDPGFEQVFGVKVLAGNLQAALTQADALALTVATAKRLFGRADVVGKTLQIAGKPYRVAATVADPAANTTIPYSALTGMNTTVWPEKDRRQAISEWQQTSCRIYVKLASGVSATILDRIVQDATDKTLRALTSDEQLRDLGQAKIVDIHLSRLSDAYFDREVAQSALKYAYLGAADSGKGDIRVVGGIAWIAGLILLLATVNYVNLATVRSLEREREIDIRKTLGASSTHIARLFLAESVLISLFSVALGLLLAWLFLPIFAEMVDRNLDNLFTPLFLFFSALFGVVVGVASGCYPTWIAMRAHAGKAPVAGSNTETNNGLWMRRILTLLEFAVATALVAVTIAIAWQAEYARKFDPGFDTTPLLVIKLPDYMLNPTCQTFRDELSSLPGVTGVATTARVLGRDHGSLNIRAGVAKLIPMELQYVSPNFFDVYGIHAVSGRLYNSKIDFPGAIDNAVINAAAAQAMGFSSADAAVGQVVRYEAGVNKFGTTKIVGIAPDIRYETLRESPRPIGYTLANPLFGSVLTARVDGDMDNVRQEIEALWRRYFPNDVLNMEYSKSLFIQNYDGDLRLAEMLTASSIIAIAIAAFGVYVLSAYNVQRRAREIVLRKLHGAKRRDIARFVGRELIVLVAIGASIGLPVAALCIEYYLSSYVERAAEGLWPLVIALVAVVLVACAATIRHTLIATRLAPSLALRC
jgi:putative ABC transport system permease protein